MTLPHDQLEAIKREVSKNCFIPQPEFEEDIAIHNALVRAVINYLASTGRLMPEWQPIDTAPKDGKSFLVHTPDNNCTYQVYRRPDAGDKFLSWISGNDLEKYQAVKFTHWMPLPNPPAAKGE